MPEPQNAANVREAYDFFDYRRDRDKPLDEGDMQNIHAWMLAVTRALEARDGD